jgi:protein MpaA
MTHRRTRALHRGVAALAVFLVVTGLATVVSGPSAAGAAQTMPGVYQSRVLGYSVQHRPIVAYRMGTATAKTKAIILGEMHGDEIAGVNVVNQILHGRAIRNIDLWVIPTMNPDGFAHRSHGNAHGVDLNRNFPYRWRVLHGYHASGPGPLSEPESRAMYGFLQQIKPNLMVSMHQPFGGIDTTDGGARNPAFRNALSAGLGLPSKPFTCSGGCFGSMTGWITATQKGAAITVEFPAHPTAALLDVRAPAAILAAMGAVH